MMKILKKIVEIVHEILTIEGFCNCLNINAEKEQSDERTANQK